MGRGAGDVASLGLVPRPPFTVTGRELDTRVVVVVVAGADTPRPRLFRVRVGRPGAAPAGLRPRQGGIAPAPEEPTLPLLGPILALAVPANRVLAPTKDSPETAVGPCPAFLVPPVLPVPRPARKVAPDAGDAGGVPVVPPVHAVQGPDEAERAHGPVVRRPVPVAATDGVHAVPGLRPRVLAVPGVDDADARDGADAEILDPMGPRVVHAFHAEVGQGVPEVRDDAFSPDAETLRPRLLPN